MKQARSAVLALVMAAATVTTASHSWAQGQGPSQAPAVSEAMTDKARDLYNEGRALYARQAWDKAHASFLAAWSLKKHWQIAGMLGHCEVQMGRYRDAAEHLSFSIRTGAGSASPEEMKKLQQSLDAAKQKVGTIDVQVDTDAAEVRVNGRSVGTSPLYDPLFVEPGEYVLLARTDDRSSSEVKVDVEAGGTKEIVLRVDREAVREAPDAGVAVVGTPDGGPTRDGGVEPSDGSTGRSLTPAIIGSAVAVVGLGVGVGFTLSANGKESDRDDAVAAIGGANACGVGTPYGAQCAEIQDLDDSASSRRKVAIGGFVVGGLALAGTAVYLLWPSGEDTTSSARLTPLVGPEGGGFQLVGSF